MHTNCQAQETQALRIGASIASAESPAPSNFEVSQSNLKQVLSLSLHIICCVRSALKVRKPDAKVMSLKRELAAFGRVEQVRRHLA
jgi:hypothetical protein